MKPRTKSDSAQNRGAPGEPLPSTHAESQTPTEQPPLESLETLGQPHDPGAGTTFTSGQVVAGRFKILRFVAHGGMGEVYEAEDLELQGLVAIKTVRPAIADDKRAMERFRREIQLARRVTHPNVCRVFDVFHHTAARADGQERAVTFLTMEMLTGETLTERLRRSGPMKPAEALPIVRQMAAALTAAHDAGVIHRDFKSANVMLMPASADRPGPRAVVTDFGLAHRSVESESVDGASLTGVGALAGTPAYMAPEQVEGGKITAAIDVYALGIVIYEMVTGRWPFSGNTPLSIAVKRLHEPPPPPRSYVSDLDPAWEAAILRCLERDPSERFASASEVSGVLSGEEVAAGARARRVSETRRRRMIVGSSGLAALLLLGAVGYHVAVTRRLREAASAPAATAPGGRRSVAVLGFKNLSARPDTAWLSGAFSEMLAMELAAGEKLRTIAGENVARVKAELTVPDADSLARDTLGRLGRSLGTEVVALGSYFALGKEGGGKIRLDMRLQDTAAGETLATLTENGTEAELPDLVSRLGGRVREKLGVGGISAAETSGAKASLPSRPEVARLYSEGVAKLRVFDAVAARTLLDQAVAIDPNYPLAHSALSQAWASLGDGARARAEAKKAFDLSGALSREERLVIEGRYRRSTRELQQAIQIYQTLWGFFPDNLDYAVELAPLQAWNGKQKEAQATLAAMRKLPPPASQDPRVDLAEATVAGSMRDLKRWQAAAARAADKGAKLGARYLVAEARMTEAWALNDLGLPERAAAAREEVKRIYSEAGDRMAYSRALNQIAFDLNRQGRLAEARKLHEEALAISRELGNESASAWTLGNIASLLQQQGALDEAKTRLEESLQAFRHLGDKNGEAIRLVNIAFLLREKGDLPGARRHLEHALEIARQTDNKADIGWRLTNLGALLTQAGSYDEARKRFDEAQAIFRDLGDRPSEAFGLGSIARLLREQGDFDGAKAMYERSLALFRELGDRSAAAGVMTQLAMLVRSHGDPAGAVKWSEQALQLHREIGDPSSVGTALNNVAVALSDMGDLAGARRRYEEALALQRKLGNQSSVGLLLDNIALVTYKQGRLPEARTRMEEALTVLKGSGNRSSLCHAITAMGLIRQDGGDLAGGIAQAQEAVKLCESLGRRDQMAFALFRWGDALRLQGDLRGARKKHDEALALRTSLNLKANLAESRLGLAMLALDEGRAAVAEGLARQAADELLAAKRPETATAAATQADAFLALGKSAEARAALERALQRSAGTQHAPVRFAVALTEARSRAASGQPKDAVKSLTALVDQTGQAGFVALQLEARLALAAAEIRAGDIASARARLELLEREAAEKGFKLLASKAAAMRRSV